MNDLISAALIRLISDRTLAYQEAAPPAPTAFPVKVVRADGRKIFAVPLGTGSNEELEIRPISNGSVRAGDIGAAFYTGGTIRGVFRSR
ncbi:hypothetical protein [Leptolyngbya sp. FACHB-16]|uniref:hypothetical protein n=1 Tax=unclassified Leptolyngbya TaxID=2650499 RepID=UPI0016898ECA|nr:hypothetical protein [Leptolyngbya sp. FACHB-16]MBD2156245.1 hypothetical protein [Leptolyngbya sp. FACHB-16]